MNISMLTERLRRRRWLFPLLVAAALTFGACDLIGDDSDDEQEQQAQQAEVQQEDGQQEAAAEPPPAERPAAEEPGPEPPPEAAGGGQGAMAYSILFPSVARVSVGDAAATGLVISQGLVVVDGAVLNGAMAADVRLSNGDTLTALPVVGGDVLTGLVYLGPLDSSLVRLLPGARLGDGEGLQPGSSVFSVGYGAGDSADVLPGVFSGVISGFSEWEPGQRTILRTDIALPLSSGGMVLVDASGTVIGMAAADTADDGAYVSTGDLARSLALDPPTADGPTASVVTATEHVLTLAEGQQSVSLFVGAEAEDSPLVTVRTETASSLRLFDRAGELLQEAALVRGSTIVALALETVGPYEIVVAPSSAMMMAGDGDDAASEAMPEPVSYEVSANVPLMAVAEAEEAAVLNVNEPFVGAIDRAGDTDSFDLALRAGAVYEILLQSLLVDAVLRVEGGGLDALDDDTGGGFFGQDSALTLAPEMDSIVRLTVKDYSDLRTGGYVLTINQTGGPAPEDETAMEEDEASGAMAMNAALPAPSPPPAVSLRGIGSEAGLQATLLGIGSQSAGNALVVDDADGAFEITVSVIGRDGALGRVFLLDSGGDVVVEGRVPVTCAGSCLAQAVFVANEGQAGQWTVLLSADAPGISEWQIEVSRND